MSTDLKEIKQTLLEENRIQELLEKMECECIKERSNRYEAQLPDKFYSDNSRSVQVYLNESISCKIRSKGISYGMDIYGLVSYIVFDIYDETEQLKNLYKAKKWICEQLGYQSTYSPIVVKSDPLKWLKDVRKKRMKPKRVFNDNEIYEENMLNQYVMFPHKKYIDEGIEYETQIEFQVGYDVQSERIIFPVYNAYGELISVKARTLDPDYKIKDIPKFLYFPNFNKMIELYNWHRALYYILEKKEVIIFEAEKSCWLSSQFGRRNCVAISGDDLSEYQVDLIKNLGNDIKIIIALDKDKAPDDFIKQARKFGHTRVIYAMWDSNDLLSKELKQSPVDVSKKVFDMLYKECFTHRINTIQESK
ncbi:DNA primase [Paenibacillus sp. N1-5-1-14]|uniref:DNA primase n=1 Tax=Paenibacillus radicibacter TaxID=2972488 RepID=UPI002159A911|nr:DNA primase [Paenibacillus radicibacter]MCR8641414.1 DNA primase [Paenibacillus radicibacter]